jgi:hypothetical protein
MLCHAFPAGAYLSKEGIAAQPLSDSFWRPEMTQSTPQAKATAAVAAYLIGAVPWGLFELVTWAQPGVPYSVSDVVIFTLIWPLRFLMWFFLT